MNSEGLVGSKRCGRSRWGKVIATGLGLVFCAGYFQAASGYYTTSGQNIVDRATRKQVIQLHGFGIGGWLLPEGYMWGSNNYDCPAKIEPAIISLIGAQNAAQFWQLYFWNYLTEQDIKAMKGWGVNAIRVPLRSNLIQPDTGQPSAPPYNYNPDGWTILDSLVTWCNRWSVGIIWDMHAAPGSQNGQNISNSADGVAHLWAQPSIYFPRLTDLWFKIAQRYLNQPCIIGYDLLNEPLLTNLGFNGSLLRQIYVQVTDTIRTIDTVGIVFVEGQWWARDFSILEPLNWDKHLAIAFHEYPPVTSFTAMQGNANGTPYDWGALRTKYNIPLWHGETGEVGPPYTGNAQATDFLNANNIGWSWWTHKKFNNNTQPWDCPTTTGFNTILNYWNNGGAKPSATDATTWLFDQANRTNSSYCQFLPTMVSSLHPLDPNGVASSVAPIPFRPLERGSVFYETGGFVLRMPAAQYFSVELADMSGHRVFHAAETGDKMEIHNRSLPAGTYLLRVRGSLNSWQQMVAVPHS